ncbi:hypothetical protein [Abditibacterium utsteinense]|uniref:hypothetical protein n=1 Tax=Abditibacterium utsteinense TaxID=1960156 RepID=UPI0013009755|nr:hypothetical protein [Abditibacterium utsteinense]
MKRAIHLQTKNIGISTKNERLATEENEARKISQKMVSLSLVKPFRWVIMECNQCPMRGASLLSAMFRRGGRQALITSPARRRVFASVRSSAVPVSALRETSSPARNRTTTH